MYDIFQKAFPVDPGFSGETRNVGFVADSPEITELVSRFGGMSFSRGLYRVMRSGDVDVWNSRVAFAFPEFENVHCCFGYDWLGRVFGLDARRAVDGRSGVLMFEPGTGEMLEIPANIESFHDRELLVSGDSALAINFHNDWLASGGAQPAYHQCIGYKRPLYLGGADTIGNLELSDIDVYWHFSGQMIRKARGLPIGTPVKIKSGE